MISFDFESLCGLICIDHLLAFIIENDDSLVKTIGYALALVECQFLLIVFFGFFVNQPASVICKSHHKHMNHDKCSKIPPQRHYVLDDVEW